MQPKYEQLRRAIYRSDAERERFLQLVVNCVMATDIVNPQLKELRNGRWEKAFKIASTSDDDAINRKATIVVSNCLCLCSYWDSFCHCFALTIISNI